MLNEPRCERAYVCRLERKICNAFCALSTCDELFSVCQILFVRGNVRDVVDNFVVPFPLCPHLLLM